MKRAPLVENPGPATFSPAPARRRYVRLRTDRLGRPQGWPRGEHRGRAGDRALVYLGAGLTIDDKLRVVPTHFFAPWTIDEEREAHERGGKPYEERSARRPPSLR